MPQILYWQMMFAVLVPATLYASWNDYRHHRVPNGLNAVIVFFGLGSQWFCNGLAGLQAGLAGILVGFGMLIVLWAMKGMGAGDVKFMASIGAWLGPQLTFYAVIVGGLIGGVLALAMILRRRQWREASANMGLLLTKIGSFRTAFSDFGSARSISLSGSMMPYAIPLTLGTMFVLVSNYTGWWEVL